MIRRKGSVSWLLAKEKIDTTPESVCDLTLKDLESQYRTFRSFAHEDNFRKRTFECWGRLGGDSFKHLGFQTFTNK